MFRIREPVDWRLFVRVMSAENEKGSHLTAEAL
jgi:hypothetical protein